MMEVRAARISAGVKPSYKRVDTCAAEFEADTPYMYSCYDGDDEMSPTNGRKVLILGGGPNRIGQGIEFDYCCCHASYSLRKVGVLLWWPPTGAALRCVLWRACCCAVLLSALFRCAVLRCAVRAHYWSPPPHRPTTPQ
jgi:hypothetical protein